MNMSVKSKIIVMIVEVKKMAFPIFHRIKKIKILLRLTLSKAYAFSYYSVIRNNIKHLCQVINANNIFFISGLNLYSSIFTRTSAKD